MEACKRTSTRSRGAHLLSQVAPYPVDAGILKRSLPLATAVLVAAFPFFLSPARGSDSTELEVLLDEGRLDRAEERVDVLLAEAPGDPALLFTRALIADRRNEPAKAMEIYGKLIRSHPTLLAPYNNLAVHHAREGDYEAAVSVLEAALRSDSAVAAAYENLTAIYAQLAGAAYREALNATAPLPPLELATLDRIDSLPAMPEHREPAPGVRDGQYVDSTPQEVSPEEVRTDGTALAPGSTAANAGAGADSQPPESVEPGEETRRDILATIQEYLAHMNLASREQLMAQEEIFQGVLERVDKLELRLRELEQAMPAAGPETPDESTGTGRQDSAEPPTPTAEAKTPVREAETAAGSAVPPAMPRMAATATGPAHSSEGPPEDVHQWEQVLIGRITNWAEAWSNRDMEQYLSHYSDQFAPPDGMGLDEWQTQLQQDLDADEQAMEVDVNGFSIQPDGDTATVSFSRHLRSAHSDHTSLKTLVMKMERGVWRIVRELN